MDSGTVTLRIKFRFSTDRPILNRFRVVAFVGAAHEGIAEAQAGDDFGGTGNQRDDAE
ncbi:hypothetical protein XM38_026200 [Halomicronema hongdechloris C2206]|uniref:Uncharacterized protein n=1 Tax=Halomicronema hongdechloris C2206 TaxID=1641165 RepID=A0A1Z3HN27_9CYAN|nr:hypothetical protein XM38_026200 [Halomicronema hongdechloris C2206]